MPIPLTAEMVGATAAVVVPAVGAAVIYLRLYVGKAMTTLQLELSESYVHRSDCIIAHGDLQKWMGKVSGGIADLDKVLSTRLTKLETIAAANAGRDYHARQRSSNET